MVRVLLLLTVPSGVIVCLERGQHFEDVNDRKNKFAIALVNPCAHHDLSGNLRHAFAIANPGLKIAKCFGVKLVDFAFRDRAIRWRKLYPHCSRCIHSLWLSASTIGLAWLLACQSARVFAEFSIPNPADIDVILFCKGLGVEMAFLGALSVHKVELLELAVGQPALERYKRNPSFRGCFAPLRQPQSNKAAARLRSDYRLKRISNLFH
jgi:hypothetical protein